MALLSNAFACRYAAISVLVRKSDGHVGIKKTAELVGPSGPETASVLPPVAELLL